MWKPLSVISSFLLLGTAFVTFKFKEEVVQEKQLLKEGVDNHTSAQARASEAKNALDKDRVELSTAQGEQTRMSSELADAKSKKTSAKSAEEASRSQLADVEKQKMEWNDKIKDLGGLDVIKQELTQLANKKTESEGKIQQSRATIALNLQKKADQEAGIAALKKKAQMQAQGLLADNFSAAVSDVNPTYNFITINKGNSANVVRNAKLDVVRGAEKIATLIVRDVQTGSAICDVLSGTLAAGQQVQAGDNLKVNAESSEKALVTATSTPAAAAPAAAAPAAAADPFGGGAPAAAPAPAASAPAADPFGGAPAPAAAPEAAAAPAAPAAPAADPFAPAPAPK